MKKEEQKQTTESLDYISQEKNELTKLSEQDLNDIHGGLFGYGSVW